MPPLCCTAGLAEGVSANTVPVPSTSSARCTLRRQLTAQLGVCYLAQNGNTCAFESFQSPKSGIFYIEERKSGTHLSQNHSLHKLTPVSQNSALWLLLPRAEINWEGFLPAFVNTIVR